MALKTARRGAFYFVLWGRVTRTFFLSLSLGLVHIMPVSMRLRRHRCQTLHRRGGRRTKSVPRQVASRRCSRRVSRRRRRGLVRGGADAQINRCLMPMDPEREQELVHILNQPYLSDAKEHTGEISTPPPIPTSTRVPSSSLLPAPTLTTNVAPSVNEYSAPINKVLSYLAKRCFKITPAFLRNKRNTEIIRYMLRGESETIQKYWDRTCFERAGDGDSSWEEEGEDRFQQFKQAQITSKLKRVKQWYVKLEFSSKANALYVPNDRSITSAVQKANFDYNEWLDNANTGSREWSFKTLLGFKKMGKEVKNQNTNSQQFFDRVRRERVRGTYDVKNTPQKIPTAPPCIGNVLKKRIKQYVVDQFTKDSDIIWNVYKKKLTKGGKRSIASIKDISIPQEAIELVYVPGTNSLYIELNLRRKASTYSDAFELSPRCTIQLPSHSNKQKQYRVRDNGIVVWDKDEGDNYETQLLNDLKIQVIKKKYTDFFYSLNQQRAEMGVSHTKGGTRMEDSESTPVEMTFPYKNSIARIISEGLTHTATKHAEIYTGLVDMYQKYFALEEGIFTFETPEDEQKFLNICIERLKSIPRNISGSELILWTMRHDRPFNSMILDTVRQRQDDIADLVRHFHEHHKSKLKTPFSFRLVGGHTLLNELTSIDSCRKGNRRVATTRLPRQYIEQATRNSETYSIREDNDILTENQRDMIKTFANRENFLSEDIGPFITQLIASPSTPSPSGGALPINYAALTVADMNLKGNFIDQNNKDQLVAYLSKLLNPTTFRYTDIVRIIECFKLLKQCRGQTNN